MGDYRFGPDGVQERQATRKEMEQLQLAKEQMQQVRAPLLLEGRHDRIFVVGMDGTGNSRYHDKPESTTLIAHLYEQLINLEHPQIAAGYVEGIGTQDLLGVRLHDGWKATTFDARVEQAYLEFCVQASAWRQEDPDARIHLVAMGFSRGGEMVAALQRMVHERGIRDPGGVEPVYGRDGVLARITWADRPLLVPPGETLQVATLIDPVATGAEDKERRLPPSTIGLLQFTTLLEPRDGFQGTLHAPFGLSDGGRVANLAIPGAHADAARSYLHDGIGRAVSNMATGYMNTLFGERLLELVPEPHDRLLHAVHRSDQHQLGALGTRAFRNTGERSLHTDLGPSCKVVAQDPCLREPSDWRLVERVEWNYVERVRPPQGRDAKLDKAYAAIAETYRDVPGPLDRFVARSNLPLGANLLDALDLARSPEKRAERLSEALAEGKRHLDAAFDTLVEGAGKGDRLLMDAAARMYWTSPLGLAHRLATGPEQAGREQEEGIARRQQDEAMLQGR